MYFPQMIKAGMVYKAVPPLYSIKEGKKRRYFTENIDMVRFIQRNFNQKYKITDLKNNKISDRDMSKFFIRNADYIYYLEDVANTYALDPFLLEMILNSYVTNKKFDFKKLKKEIESTYRFMTVEKEGSSIIASGTINESNAIILNDRFLRDCKMILPIIESNDVLNYKVNGKKCSIYTVMDLYNKSKPAHVQRYKGLGEMQDKELRESTMSAEGDRTLIRYTMESAKEEIEAIREYESDSKKILTLIHNVSREDLLD